MRQSSKVVAVIAVLTLAACDDLGDRGITDGSTPDTALISLTVTGEVPDQGFVTSGGDGGGSDLATVNGTLIGYAYAYGLVDGTNTYLGVAGIVPDSDPGAAITSGSVSYDGTFKLAYINMDNALTETGQITLIADFLDSSVTGASSGLVVDGNFSGTDLGGTVTYAGITAELEGVLGADALAGAFAGNTSDVIIVGGILATAN